MDAPTAFKDLYDAQVSEGELEPQWLRQYRARGWGRFERLGLPTRADEEWKYLGLGLLGQRSYERRPGGESAKSTVAAPIDRALLASVHRPDAIELVFVDGRCITPPSELQGLPAGLCIQELRTAIRDDGEAFEERLTRAASVGDHALFALSEAFLSEGCFLKVSQGTQVPRPVHLIHLSQASQTARFVRHLIELDEGARLELFETYLAAQPAAASLGGLTNVVVDALLGGGSELTVKKVQAESASAVHLAHTRVICEAEACYRSFQLSVGGELTRQSTAVRQEGVRARTVLHGLSLVKGSQESEQKTTVEHRAEAGQSEQYFKCIADEQARGVFVGKIKVCQDAQKVSAQQLNKNLLISREAEIDTKPQLEIDADDVKCSHGATVSQLRAEELFYLQCRGVAPERAKAMLAEAFASELFYKVGLDDALMARLLSEYFHPGCEEL